MIELNVDQITDPTFRVAVYGRKYMVVMADLKQDYSQPYGWYERCSPPRLNLALTLVEEPSKPPPPKRTWATAMGLRRPKRK